MMQEKSLMGCKHQLLRMQRIVFLASKKQKTSSETSDTKEKAATKKKQIEKPSKASVNDQGKGKGSKKSKKEPSREDMHAVVIDILKEVDKILGTKLMPT
ncbi:uncharacterized protein DS421_16g540290 [Arachis hypogaea]|nr:uncharacterized protein DS421_16g540290 [Arachis hypogaea]